MRLSTSWMFQQSVNQMISQQSALANTQNEVSSGQRINVASDDPAGAGQIVSLNHVIAQNTQFTANIDSATTSLNTEASTLSSINSALDSARTLALQAVNGTLSDADRTSIATQLGQIRSQLIQMANSTDNNGNPLFAGTSSTTTPFQVAGNGAVTYTGNDSQQQTSIGSGLQIATSDPGAGLFMNIPAGNGSFEASAGASNSGTLVVGANSVTDLSTWNSSLASSGGGYTITFGANGAWSAKDANGQPVLDSSGNAVTGTYTDGGSISFNGMNIALSGTPSTGDTVSVQTGGKQDVFTTLDNMIAALQPGSSDTQLTNVMSRQLESIDQAQSSISATQVAVGGRLDTLQAQQSTYSDLNVTYQSALSDVQNVDAYTAISNLSLQQTALQASLQLFAQVKSMSLFNYLK
ncbi:flagellar hook-associated protein 3 [Dyella solisilvae]|uniref:Flagellar hook-associated protein 3 n=1 Tax=Dyella solisilvae TaxID=1920168 RepID=A0A370K506_9GAMM|nr:flagellar hook-associated protein FlgL [Dyella solisilvae]RDI97723.1 flagellar hook-associated protein 3 [Dyella solisilvae]